MMMWSALATEATEAVFVTDRTGAALRRREHCLKLAGIPYVLQADQRPSGTYHRICVREADAIRAHLALQKQGHLRSVNLQGGVHTVFSSLFDFGRTIWNESRFLWEELIGFVLHAPKRLTWSGFRQ